MARNQTINHNIRQNINQNAVINNGQNVTAMLVGQGTSTMPNGWASTDTYLESCVNAFCAANGRKISIFYEWQGYKKKYIQYTNTIGHEFPHYSVHNEEHSRTIIESIEMFLGKWRVERMSIGDMWLFLNAAYGHDIGMLYEYEEALSLWRDDSDFKKYLNNIARNYDDDMYDMVSYCKQIDNILNNREKMEGIKQSEDGWGEISNLTDAWPVEIKKNVVLITSDYIRRHHAGRSKRFFNKLSEVLGIDVAENRLYKLLGKVVYAHGADMEYIENELPVETQGFGNETMHPQFIAMLLRLGDLLDMDNNRFNITWLNHFGEIPQASMIQMKKHLALSHLLITEQEIQAVERTDDYEVCRAASKWFQYIEEETRNITTHWNRVVPESFEGCTFQKCDMKIFLNGEKYECFEKNRFEVDNRKFMTLLIGDKLYKNSLIFLREYIQNAIDATKIMIWIKNRNKEELSLHENDGYKNREINPWSLDQSVLKNYEIEVQLELVENEKTDESKIRIHIIDHGIGIDEECIQTLAIIGTGWKGRKKYSDDINEMPAWMRPSGGFGVGIQSGFMMADKIRIITRGLRAEHGYEIELFTPRQSGKINYFYTANEKVGTEVILEVPFSRFVGMVYKLKREGQIREDAADKQFNSSEECFDYQYQLESIRKLIIAYIKEIVPNSCIPICVTCKSEDIRKPRRTNGNLSSFLEAFVRAKENKILSDEENSIDYVLVEGETKNENIYGYFWLREEQVFVRLTINWVNEENLQTYDSFHFKGIRIENSQGHFLSRYISADIDVMGKRAQDTLLISRSGFLEGYHKKMHDYAKICTKLYVKNVIDSVQKKNANETITSQELCALLFGVLELHMEEEIKPIYNSGLQLLDEVRTSVFTKENQKNLLKYQTIKWFHVIYEKFIRKEDQIIIWRAQQRQAEIEIDINAVQKIKRRNDITAREKIEDAICRMQSDDMSYYVIEEGTLIALLEDYAKENQCAVEYIKVNEVEPEGVVLAGLVLDSEHDSSVKEEKISSILAREIEKQNMYVEVGDSYREKYGELFVSATPRYEIDTRNKNIILIPFGKMQYTISNGGQGKEDCISWEDFWGDIVSSKMWKRAVEWVNENHKFGAGLSGKERIREKYREFCGEFYEELRKKEGKRN